VTEPLSDLGLGLVRTALSHSFRDWRSKISFAEQHGLLARLDAAEAELAATRKVVEAARQMDRRNEMSEAAAGWYEDAEALSVAIAELDAREKAE
jgi:multidrug resistance efflux pump